MHGFWEMICEYLLFCTSTSISWVIGGANMHVPKEIGNYLWRVLSGSCTSCRFDSSNCIWTCFFKDNMPCISDLPWDDDDWRGASVASGVMNWLNFVLCPIFMGTKPWYSQLYLMCRNHRPMVDFVWFMVARVPQRHHRGACLVPWWLRLHPRDDQWLVALLLQWSMISVSMIFMGYIRMTSPPKPRKPGLPATSLAYSLS